MDEDMREMIDKTKSFSTKDTYIFHGTGKGQALNIQKDGFMKTNKTGEEQPSISFTNSLDYAKYYAKAKGRTDKMVILRTKLNEKFKLSPRIRNNKGDEYITFEEIPSSDLEIMTPGEIWKPLNKWDVIFDEPFLKKEDMREMIDKVKNFKQSNGTNTLTVYHGTKPKFVDSIKTNGLEDKSSASYTQGWYMVSTDFGSALFHGHPEDNNGFVYVFEFEIPINENDRWIGYPYLWKGGKINDNATWFALMQKLPKDFIKKIHKVSYEDWMSQKNKGF